MGKGLYLPVAAMPPPPPYVSICAENSRLSLGAGRSCPCVKDRLPHRDHTDLEIESPRGWACMWRCAHVILSHL